MAETTTMLKAYTPEQIARAMEFPTGYQDGVPAGEILASELARVMNTVESDRAVPCAACKKDLNASPAYALCHPAGGRDCLAEVREAASRGHFQEIYEDALAVFGRDAQVNKAIEEAGEFIVALAHWLIGRPGAADEVAEECADVLKTAEQVRKMVGPEKVDAIRLQKNARLAHRIEQARERRQETAE